MFKSLKRLFSKSEAEFRPDRIPRPYYGPSSAGAFMISKRFVFVANGRVPSGFYLQCEPTICILQNASPEEIGQAMLTVLNAFRPSHLVPEDFASVRKAQLRAMGVRSERQLQQQALCCEFSRGLDAYDFMPTHNGGTAGNKQGFQPNNNQFSIPLSSSEAELGDAIRRAFSLCTSIYQVP